ncbi:Endonuclease YncB(Thermonuclease family) [Novosphingobium lubricantis]|jgi:endonuclease YncB( thermonuclease family)
MVVPRCLRTLAPLLAILACNAPVLGAAPDTERARFEACGVGPRVTCVVDGDTFWYAGTKIRLADINTPEVSRLACPAEALLGRRASERLQQMLNAGPFTLEVRGRDTDRYGRALRVVTRAGQSLGLQLEAEGLAEVWRGRRGDWCAGAAG